MRRLGTYLMARGYPRPTASGTDLALMAGMRDYMHMGRAQFIQKVEGCQHVLQALPF